MKQLSDLALDMFTLADDDMNGAIPTLVDSALIAALRLTIGFSGYENFERKSNH